MQLNVFCCRDIVISLVLGVHKRSYELKQTCRLLLFPLKSSENLRFSSDFSGNRSKLQVSLSMSDFSVNTKH